MPAADPLRPLVVQYLYVHDEGEAFHYPTARSGASPALVAARYLECALTQAASLRLRDADCDLLLATNVGDRRTLGARGQELLERLDAFGVRLVPTEYVRRPASGSSTYASSRYVLDAILSATSGEPSTRQLWLSDVDCVWPDAERVFAAAPAAPAVGCICIPYPPDWNAVGFGELYLSPRAMGDLAQTMGGGAEVSQWIGGELLAGTAETLRALVAACDELDARLAADGRELPAEEQILTLAGALQRVRFDDISDVARRILTGSRHHAARVKNPSAYGFWHVPSEKGLSLRRTARELCHGHEQRVRRDLADPARTARRFNVAGTGRLRRIRDDSWIATQRLRSLRLSR
jgi:hypothetical protein